MTPIKKTNISNARYEKMRSIYLGDKDTPNKITGSKGQRSKRYKTWGFPQDVINHCLLDKIYNFIKRGGCLKNVLLVSDLCFELSNVLIGMNAQNITVAIIIQNESDRANIQEWIEDYFTGTEQLNIVYLYSNDLGELMGKHFNLIISNPPYALGAQITKSLIDDVSFDAFINLMPWSYYRPYSKKTLDGLYQHVLSLELADAKAFVDADISPNLCVCSLSKLTQECNNYDELCLLTYDETYSEFYELNKKCRVTYDFISDQFDKTFGDSLQQDKTYLVDCRISTGSGYTEASFPYHYNIANDYTNADIYYCVKKTGELYSNLYGFIPHDYRTDDAKKQGSKSPKENFADFSYYNPVGKKLIKGLNKASGVVNDAIPNIDYSKERDYKNLSVQDLIAILKEENPDVK